MRPFLEEIQARLDALEADGLHRTLTPPEGIDFSSNDYLGLSRHPRIRDAALEAVRRGTISSPASRLLRGNTAEHVALEERLAAFKGTEAALLFSSGYQANLAVLAALLRSDDVAVSDELNHASIVDGLRLCGCRQARFAHLDARAAEKALAAPPARGRVFLITESLFSMDGDVAPLDRYAELVEKHGANLIVDDAHATGLYGDARGSGLVERFGVERRAVAIVSTFGKALGLAGAFVAGPRVIVEYLVNKARPFIFSTAQPPILLAAIHGALDVISAEPHLRARVLKLAQGLRDALTSHGVHCLRSEGPIVPVMLGDNDRALRVAQKVRRRGYDVRAIRPPAVPPRTARLRVSVHADHTEEEVNGLGLAIIEALREEPESPPGAVVP